jgi:hypothetical protein
VKKRKPAKPKRLTKLQRKEIMLDAAIQKARLAEQRAVELGEENERLGYVRRLEKRILALDIQELMELFSGIGRSEYGQHVLRLLRKAVEEAELP